MDASPLHPPSRASLGEPGRPARVLLVDDDPDTRGAVADLLKARFPAVVVEEITDHVAFFRALQATDFDLVITDHRLHWSSGLEVLSAVKSLRPTIPVILHAAVQETAAVDKALHAGLHAYIPKEPGHEGALGAALRSALQIVDFEDRVVSEQERHRDVLDHLSIGVFRASLSGELLAANAPLLGLLGFPSLEDAQGASLSLLGAGPDDRRHLLDRLGEDGQVRGLQLELPRADGSTVWVSLSAAVIPSDTGEAVVDGVVEDVTLQRQARIVLENANAQYRAIFEAVSAATVIVDEDQTVTMVNPAFEQLSGYPRNEVEERKAFTEFIASSDLERVREVHRRRRAEDPALPRSYEVSFVHRSGRLLQVRVNEALLPGTQRIVASLLNLTPRREAEAELLHSAFHDAMTGLPNRFHLLDRLEDLIATADPGDEFAVVVLDLDRFQLVNEAWGPRVGDALLRTVADRLRTAVLEADLLARVDGDAFAVLLHPLVHRGEARSVATVIHEALRQPFDLGGVALLTSASIGVAWRDDSGNADELLRRADAARARAKALGGDRWVPFEPPLLTPAGPALARSQDLRRSLVGGELAVALQPIVDPAAGRVVAVDAVLTLPDGVDAPWGRVVTEAGLETVAGQRLLRSACEHLRRLREVRPDLVAVVRLGRSQLEVGDQAREVDRLVGGVGLPGRAVAVAVPAQWFGDHDPVLATAVERLAAGGLGFVVDDFRGMVSGLPEARPVAVRLDPDLLSGIGDDPARWQLVEAVVVRAQALGVPVVARGVEDATHLERLRAAGCTWFETTLLAGALDLDATLELLQRE